MNTLPTPDKMTRVTVPAVRVIVDPSIPVPRYTRWTAGRLELVVRPDVTEASLGNVLAGLIAAEVEPTGTGHVVDPEGDDDGRVAVEAGPTHVGVVTLFDGEDPDRALGDLGYERSGPWRGAEYGRVCDVRRRQH